jgi:hypothetical protein
MLPTHRHLEDYRDHAIYRRQPGFEYTPVLLGRIASFLVSGPGRHLAVFAFMVPMLAEETGEVTPDSTLLNAAADIIRAAIDRGALPARLEATYEYRNGRYVAVDNPRWWVPTW